MNSPYGEIIGCDQLHYALVTADTSASYISGAVGYLAPAGEIQIEAKADINTRYYDNVPMFTSVAEGATNTKLVVSGVPASLAATLTGKPYGTAHGIVIDTGDATNTPDCALSGRMMLGDGGFRYFQFLKGKFTLGAMTAKTKTEKVSESTYDLSYTAVTTTYKFTMPDSTTKGIKGVYGDTTDPAFAATFATETAWFAQTQTPATLGSVTALALSGSVPANNATGVLATVAPTITFSNAIASDGIIIVNAASGAIVAANKAYNTAGKILTITPMSNLAAAATYLVIVDGVKDIYGQTLVASAVKFTTA